MSSNPDEVVPSQMLVLNVCTVDECVHLLSQHLSV